VLYWAVSRMEAGGRSAEYEHTNQFNDTADSTLAIAVELTIESLGWVSRTVDSAIPPLLITHTMLDQARWTTRS
jgi:hypothetical protein